MGKCPWVWQVQAACDGEPVRDEAAVRRHIPACPECGALAAGIDMLRQNLPAAASVPAIADAQFGAFMAGVREGMHAPARPWALRLWAGASLAAAALVIAASLFLLFPESGQPARVEATEVVEARTELDGATVDVELSEDGNATLWVHNAPGNLWWE